MYTAGPAWLQFSEETRGSLEAGQLADAVVIDRNFLTCPEDEIRAIEPLITIVGGSIVYDRR
jgi:predicted amidohydrolase YtcJ